MLFWFHPSIADALDDPSKSDIACTAIESIVFAQIYGNHIFYSDLHTLDRLSLNNNLGLRYRKQIRYVYNNYLDKQRCNELSPRVLALWGNTNCYINNVGIIQEFVVSADVLVNTHITERAFFLTENITDISLYKRIADVYMWEEEYQRDFYISFDSIGGGGNTIGDQYNRIQQENQKICLSIIDTDMKFGNDSIGPTATQLIQAHNINTSSGSNHHIFCNYKWISAKEIENIIPSQLLFEIVNRNGQRQEFVTWFYQLEQDNNEARFFLDVKEGFDFKNVVTHLNPIMVRYWADHLNSWYVTCNYGNNLDCPETCLCHKISGMGNNTLDNVINILDRYSNQKLDEMVKTNPMLLIRWLELGKIIFNWFVASKRFYIN